MTLILSLAQNDMVLQLSDRRVTLQQRGRPDQPSPTAINKSIIYNGRVVLGFTGLVRLEDEPSDLWIAHRLLHAGDDLDAAIRLLREDLAALFRRNPYRGNMFGIAICGFYYENDTLRPFQGILSNRKREDWQPPYSHDFTCHMSTIEDGYSGLQQAPFWLSLKETEALHQSIIDGANQIETVSRIANAIRAVADRDPMVGHDLMLSSLPLAGAYNFKTYNVGEGMPNLDNPTFSYLSKAGETTMFIPTLVMNGEIIHDMQLTRAKPWTAWR